MKQITLKKFKVMKGDYTEVIIEWKGVTLHCEIKHTHPTFEDEEQGLNGNFIVLEVYAEDSEVNIVDLLDENLLSEQVYEKLENQ